MKTNNLIQLAQFCTIHNVDTSFIFALQEYELVEIVVIEETHYLPEEQLPEVEKMLRLHYELEINLEGIDAIATLLKQIDALEKELIATKNKLRVFEHAGD
ncbi:chaperone modulator CbpM [Haliscomenobacter sp.]|uniref:chaperone modulator CbpM n=1 Tax=Haliscomenobacter sp. TaxID=2717303 RepID=UPI00359358AF